MIHSREIDRLDHLIARYGGRVPRYTSYPTAVQFSAAVGAQDYRAWLAALSAADGPVSIYIHIPFCAQLCWYCGCHTKIVNAHGPVADYVDDLLAEIDHVAAKLSQRLAIGAVHFGGGTPNMLAPSELSRIMARLAQNFDLAADADIAVELDPRLLTRAWAVAAADCGVTRVSLGVQDFRKSVQAAIHRLQPYTLIAAVVDTLHAAQISAINLDLMYGLPRQTLTGLETTVEEALTLAPDRLSLFGYAHMPWLKPHQKLIAEKDLPDARTRLLMQRQAARLLEQAGFARLGLDHFAHRSDALTRAALERRLRRNFQGYTSDSADVLLGFGASAIGRLPQGYVQNAADIGQWRRAIEAGELPSLRGVALSEDDRFRSDIIERLMCDFSVDLAAVAARHGRGIEDLDTEFDELNDMAADGLVEITDSRIDVTQDGRDFVRSVGAVFDRYLDRGAARHAQGV
jgi:oxygen-independent coproporphyrinogen-3 oxidase